MDIDPSILEAVNLYGPFAVLFLLIMPLMGEDIIIIPAGFLIGQGHLPLVSTFICAYIGALISDSAWYFVCYRYGTPLLHKRWFKRLAHPRRLLQAKHQIETRGAWLIVTSRFVPGSRTTTMIVSGLMHMPVWKFLLAEGLLLLVTVSMQLGLGYLVAQHIVESKGAAATIMSLVGLVVLLIVAAFVINWWASHRKSEARSPRSKVLWLKRFRPKRLPRLRMQGIAARQLGPKLGEKLGPKLHRDRA
jgi:membrane protein DedA with SNARE-associated domain